MTIASWSSTRSKCWDEQCMSQMKNVLVAHLLFHSPRSSATSPRAQSTIPYTQPFDSTAPYHPHHHHTAREKQKRPWAACLKDPIVFVSAAFVTNKRSQVTSMKANMDGTAYNGRNSECPPLIIQVQTTHARRQLAFISRAIFQKNPACKGPSCVLQRWKSSCTCRLHSHRNKIVHFYCKLFLSF